MKLSFEEISDCEIYDADLRSSCNANSYGCKSTDSQGGASLIFGLSLFLGPIDLLNRNLCACTVGFRYDFSYETFKV